jgi:hypothetical protein
MKLHGNININGKQYSAGDEVSWLNVYPFLLIHTLSFGLAGFILAYGGHKESALQYILGAGAIVVYIFIYYIAFGRDTMKWLLINSALGAMGIYYEFDRILSLFGKSFDQFPWHAHIIPISYYILYTFLLRQALLDITRSRENESRRKITELGYVIISISVYLLI